MINEHSNVNGVFKFTIDGKDFSLANDHLLSGTWFTHKFDVEPGFHVLEWVYMKYQNLRDDEQEELAAEFEYIKIKGIEYAPQQCDFCHKGVANEARTKCLLCPQG